MRVSRVATERSLRVCHEFEPAVSEKHFWILLGVCVRVLRKYELQGGPVA